MKKYYQKAKRLLVILLACIIIITGIPTNTFAEDLGSFQGQGIHNQNGNNLEEVTMKQVDEKPKDMNKNSAPKDDNKSEDNDSTDLENQQDGEDKDNSGLDSDQNATVEDSQQNSEDNNGLESDQNISVENNGKEDSVNNIPENAEEETNNEQNDAKVNEDSEDLGRNQEEENTDRTKDIENKEKDKSKAKQVQFIQSQGTIKVITTLKKYQYQGADQDDNRGEINPGVYDYYDIVDSWYLIKSGNHLYWINTEWILNQGSLLPDKNLICYANTDGRRIDKTPQGQLEERGMIQKGKIQYYSKRDGSFYLIQQHFGNVWVNIEDMQVSDDDFMPTQGRIELEYGRKYYENKYDETSTGILTNNDNHNPNVDSVSYYYSEYGNGWMLMDNHNGSKWIKLNETPVVSAPDLVADDIHNIIVGNDSNKTNMEYAIDDSTNWTIFYPDNPPIFPRDTVVKVRFKSVNNNPPSEITELTFKYNYKDNFDVDKQLFDDIIANKRGYLNVKHYEISQESNGNGNTDPALDQNDRYKMFGTESYVGYKYQTPMNSKKYAESDIGSLYFYQNSNGSHNDDAFYNAINMWGYFVPEKTGYYNLIAYADDGVYGQVTISNQDIVFAKSWRYQSPSEITNNRKNFMEEGKIYPIYIDFFENKKNQVAFELRMNYNDGHSEVVPGSYLYPTNRDLSYVKMTPVSNIEIEPKTKVMDLNESNTVQLTATIIPTNATNKRVVWSSDNEAVATVDSNGLVTVYSIGTANITATSEDRNYQDHCVLTVNNSLTGDPNEFFYASDNRGTLVKYYPYSTSDKTVKVADFIGNYRDIATLPDGTLIGISPNGYLYEDIELGGTYIRYLDNDINALTADTNGNLYYAKEKEGIIKKYNMYDNETTTIVYTDYKSRGDLVFLNENTLYYTGYDKNNAYLIKIDMITKDVTNLGNLSGKPYGIAAIDNILFVTYVDKGKSYVDAYDSQGNKLWVSPETMQYLKQVHGAAQGIKKVIANAPVAKDVSIEGIAKVGEVLTGVYTYDDLEGDEEGNSIFHWYADTGRNNSYEFIADATNKTFVVPQNLLGNRIKFEVTPIAKTGLKIQGNPVLSEPTKKVSLELVGPYDYDYFYINADDGDLVKYYPEYDFTEDVANTNKIYLDIANNNDVLFGINGNNLFKNIHTQAEVFKQLSTNTVNSLTYNNGLFYYVDNLWLMAYSPMDETFYYLKYLGYDSRGDLVAFDGKMYFLAADYNKTKLIEIDFDNNYSTSLIGTYDKSNLFGVAVANNTLFVAYGKRIAKVNISNGSLYDEQSADISSAIYGAAQGGYYTPVSTEAGLKSLGPIDEPAFNTDTTEYIKYLQPGTEVRPDVTYETIDENATVEVTKDNDNVEGVTTVVVTAEDGVSTKTYKVEFILHHKPVITLNGDTTVTVAHNGTYEEKGATASDEEDGNLTSAIAVTGTVITSVSGTYTIRYNVTDSNGYQADEVTRTVIVEKDNEAKLKELGPIDEPEFNSD